MTPTSKPFASSLGISYPSTRDEPLKTGAQWLRGKRADDGAEGLWRVHNSLYDLEDFVETHPGGSDWLQLTKGTDITEAFEAHHITPGPSKLLKRFFVRQAKTSRNSPFTFEEHGFYRTLKKRIGEELERIPQTGKERSKTITDFLFFSYLILALLAAIFRSFSCGLMSGIFLSMTAIASHNFFHKRDNFRMYYFNFTMMDFREWRISHALSHHLHTNTINDLEISVIEPFLNYLPGQKVFRYVQMIISPVLYAMVFVGSFIKGLIQIAVKEKPFSPLIFLPFSTLVLMIFLTGQLIFPTIMFTFIIFIGSLHFGVVGINAAHHHPDIFHDGDTPRPKYELDWGIYQLDAVMDRKDITGSHFLVLTTFGDHALHHLFPTIDHGLLEYLYPTFLKVCAQFGTEWRLSSTMELTKGQFRQLVKEKPKKEPPRALKIMKSL